MQLQKNVEPPVKSDNRLFLIVLALAGIVMVVGTVFQGMYLDARLPAPRVDVTITVTPTVQEARMPIIAPAIPSAYEACMDYADHHDDLRPIRCCKQDETCVILEKTTVVDFTAH